jgi:hypothetical protein
VKVPRRLLSTPAQPHTDALSRATRNIGIIAHIDAVSSKMNSTCDDILMKIGQNDYHGAHALLQWAYKKNRKYVNFAYIPTSYHRTFLFCQALCIIS